MGKLARVCAVLAVCLSALSAFPQAAVFSSQVIDINGQPLPYAKVRVCSATSTGTPCQPPVPIFQDYALTIPASDPYTTDQYGNYTIFAPALPTPNLYVLQVSPASGTTWSYVQNGPYCSLGGCTISGNLTVTGNVNILGSLTACSVNGVVNATCFLGADIGAKVNAALASCSDQCTVYIPAGLYSYSTQIVLPQNIFGRYKLTGEPGTVLTWTGTTDAIVTKPTSIGASNLTIEGFQLNGTGSFAGIHLYPTNRITVQNMLIQGFTDGIRVEGTNSSNILNNLITNNINGIKLLSTFCSGTEPNYTCSPSNLSGSLQAANAINIDHNQITVNQQWGVIFVDSPGNGDSGSLGSNVSYNDLEENGLSGSSYGAIYSGKSTGLLVSHNYLEGSPRQVVLGLLGAGSYWGTVGAVVENNFYTTLPATPYNIELQNADRTTIKGNSEQGGAGVGGSNCFINVGGVETSTVLLPNSIVQSPPNGNRLCIAGTAAQTFAGANSFIIFNQNYQASVAFGVFNIGTGTSDTVTSVNVAPTSECFATAWNATSFTFSPTLLVTAGSGNFTIYHAPSGGGTLPYTVWCSGPLNNE